MSPGMFDGMIRTLLLIGAAFGIGCCGLVWLVIYLCQHVTIGWTP